MAGIGRDEGGRHVEQGEACAWISESQFKYVDCREFRIYGSIQRLCRAADSRVAYDEHNNVHEQSVDEHDNEEEMDGGKLSLHSAPQLPL